MFLDDVTIEFSTLEEALAKMPALPTPVKFVMAGRPASYSACANTPEQYRERAAEAFAYLSLSVEERRERYPPIPCRKRG